MELLDTLTHARTPHHGYLVVPLTPRMRREAEEAVRTFFEIPPSHPDFHIVEAETFGIDEARALKERHSRRAVTEVRIFFVVARLFTREAQNALLKLLEEPGENTFFFLLAEREALLLPTLISRLVVVRGVMEGGAGEVAGGGKVPHEGKAFLALTPAERLQKVQVIVARKERAPVAGLLDSLEEALSAFIREGGKEEKRATAALCFIWWARHMNASPAASKKLILEHLSLTMPIIHLY